jgi:riboflavin kinase/FMN adenylyltransferase
MRYTARVIPGRGEGRKLGFPTLNLEIPAGFNAKQGVYAGWAWVDSEGRRPAAIHYGPAPTFGVKAASLEVHVINAYVPTPPPEISFELVKYLREIKDFNGLEALARQIQADVQAALEALK